MTRYIAQEYSCTITGYFPPPPEGYKSEEEAEMEGGDRDRRGTKLETLGQYCRGEVNSVSVAMDGTKAGRRKFPYGTMVSCPWLNEKFGREIPLIVCDTGRAFSGKGGSAMDICVDDNDMATKVIGKRRVTIYAMIKEEIS